MEPTKTQSPLTVPVAIIVAGALIAVALVWNKKAPVPAQQAAEVGTEEANVAPVTSADHVLGNPDAKIMLVEYSDTSCPYCKEFHPVLKKLMDEYGKDGTLAWTYRHYPLDKPDRNGQVLHPNAGIEARATECAAELGGNAKFWAYTDRIFEVTQSTEGISLPRTQLPEIAAYVGLDKAAFSECLASGRHADTVEADFVSGVNAGVSGTPSSFLVTKNGTYPVSGYKNYAGMKAVIEAVLQGQ
jgi:protein-disulfide isomerase